MSREILRAYAVCVCVFVVCVYVACVSCVCAVRVVHVYVSVVCVPHVYALYGVCVWYVMYVVCEVCCVCTCVPCVVCEREHVDGRVRTGVLCTHGAHVNCAVWSQQESGARAFAGNCVFVLVRTAGIF